MMPCCAVLRCLWVAVLLRAPAVAAAAGGGHSSTGTRSLPVRVHYRVPGSLDARAFTDPRHQRHAERMHRVARMSVLADTMAPAPESRVVRPQDHGADPSGRSDASTAMEAAVNALTSLGGERDAQGRVDLGGAILDLAGGIFQISKPLLIPPGYANFRVQRGTLFAGSGFPTASTDYLMHIGGKSCNSTSGGKRNKNCNSNVDVQQMTFDGANIAFGALMVQDTMNVNVGPAIMVTGFQGVGINLAGSGAGYIHEAWLGQYEPGKTPEDDSDLTATAILLAGAQHDCDVQNVIVFSGRIGVNSSNGANRLQGVHTWNLMGSRGGTGILLYNGVGRVEQAYLDYAPLVIRCKNEASADQEVAMVEGCLFLGSSTIILQAAAADTTLHGLIATGNVFHTWSKPNATFVLDESSGTFTGVQDTTVENNQIGKLFTKLSTRATKTGSFGPNSSSLVLDFSDSLIFGAAIGINTDSTSCTLLGRHASALAVEAVGNTLHVVLGTPTPAGGADPEGEAAVRVACSVDQSTRTCAAH